MYIAIIKFFTSILKVLRRLPFNQEAASDVRISKQNQQTPNPQPEPPTYSIEILATAIRDYEGYTPNSRAYRNCNPGNCRYSKSGYLPKYGIVKKDPDGFAIFKDYETGFLYLKNLLKDKISKNPNWKLDDLMSWYAPSADHNDPYLYATYLAKRLDVDKNTFKISSIV